MGDDLFLTPYLLFKRTATFTLKEFDEMSRQEWEVCTVVLSGSDRLMLAPVMTKFIHLYVSRSAKRYNILIKYGKVNKNVYYYLVIYAFRMMDGMHSIPHLQFLPDCHFLRQSYMNI
jgi:hypothetical protein